MTYSLDNPHPNFGKDPNIINELGHTIYPKYVDGIETYIDIRDKKEKFVQIIVNSKEEEAEAAKALAASKKGTGAWPK